MCLSICYVGSCDSKLDTLNWKLQKLEGNQKLIENKFNQKEFRKLESALRAASLEQQRWVISEMRNALEMNDCK